MNLPSRAALYVRMSTEHQAVSSREGMPTPSTRRRKGGK